MSESLADRIWQWWITPRPLADIDKIMEDDAEQDSELKALCEKVRALEATYKDERKDRLRLQERIIELEAENAGLKADLDTVINQQLDDVSVTIKELNARVRQLEMWREGAITFYSDLEEMIYDMSLLR